ncbi:MAG: TonB family protein, partial [Bacteroidetes bacterium]
YVDEAGNQPFKIKFKDAMGFREGLAAVAIKDKWGFINEKGEVFIDLKYDKAGTFRFKRSVVTQGKLYSLINEKGDRVTAEYDTIYRRGNFYIMRENDLLGVMDSVGQILENPKFDKIGSFYNNQLTVKFKDNWGVWENGELDTSNRELYLSAPEEFPVFREVCESFESPKEKKRCSDSMLLVEVQKNIKYPIEARNKGIQGRVFIHFVIDRHGKARDFRIVRSIGGGCDEEALRVARDYLNVWSKPGKQDGIEVNTIFYLPVHFRLE